MRFEFRLPDIGEGVVEGEIVEWHVKPGDFVQEDDLLLEVMTDKATVQIPSPRNGNILETFGAVGETVPVGMTLVVIEVAGVAAEAAVAAPAHGHTPSAASAHCVPGVPEAVAAVQPVLAAGGNGSANGHQPGRKALATPAVRRQAHEMGININSVTGSGPLGRVSREDLLNHAQAGQTAAATVAPPKAPSYRPAPLEVTPEVMEGKVQLPARPAAATTSGSYPGPVEETPFRGLRKAIAEKMSRSAFTATHFTYVEEVDMTDLARLRDEVKYEYIDREGFQITFLPFIIKAVIGGLKQYPVLNGTLDEERAVIVRKLYYNIGVAVATDSGLIVPVLKDADKKSIRQLAQEIHEMSSRARAGKNSLDELRDGTFTITSLGKDGGLFATPIINFPELGIIGIHKIRKMPVVRDDDRIEIRQIMNLSCSFDHRIIDGHVGAAFTNVVARALENPRRLLLE